MCSSPCARDGEHLWDRAIEDFCEEMTEFASHKFAALDKRLDDQAEARRKQTVYIVPAINLASTLVIAIVTTISFFWLSKNY